MSYDFDDATDREAPKLDVPSASAKDLEARRRHRPRFAERGEGTVRGVTVDGRRELRLYVAPYFVWFSVTPASVIA